MIIRSFALQSLTVQGHGDVDKALGAALVSPGASNAPVLRQILGLIQKRRLSNSCVPPSRCRPD